MLNIKKHYSLTTSDVIDTICAPLKQLNITYFSFVRTFEDSSFCVLTCRPDWTEHFLTQKQYHTSTFEQHPNCYNSGSVLWSCIEDDQARIDARNFFNISNGITLIEKQHQCCDMYHFASTNESSMIQNFYISNMDVLKKFILYFKDKANLLIKEATHHKILIPASATSLSYQADLSHNLKSLHIFEPEGVLSQLKLTRFPLNNEFYGQWLTKQECLCIAWVMLGKTMNEIGVVLQISPKTVEEYIDNVKKKLNCFKQTVVIYKLAKQGFDPQLFI
jgi:DNA-binding CsgD family transcriptional regulator